MSNTHAQAYVEILEIIKNMEQDYKDKIPKKLIEFFEKNKDNNYKYNIYEAKDIVFSQKTVDLLAMLELKYLATEKEKEILEEALDENDKRNKRELAEKYNPDNLFKEEKQKVEKNEYSNALVECKESIFTKIKNFFRYFFRKNKVEK